MDSALPSTVGMSGAGDVAKIVTPTQPSTASRVPSLRSKGSLRGALVTTDAPRRLVYESNLEKSAILVLLAGDVVDLRDQPPAVRYKDAAGIWKTHTFDLLAHMADGRRIAIEIKPADRAQRKNLKDLLETIAAQIPRTFATHVAMITEADLPRDRVRDARLIHAVRRDAMPEDDAVVALMITDLEGSASIGALVRASGLEGRAFRSIVRLIANGDLTVVRGRPIDYGTLVTRTRREAASIGSRPAAVILGTTP